MAAATGTVLIQEALSHLGSRSSGYVGDLDVNEAALRSVNSALYRIVKRTTPRNLLRNANITVTTATYKYAEPTTDSGSNAITIRNYISMIEYKSGETVGYPVKKLLARQKDCIFPLTNNSNETGRPMYYSVFAGYIELFPYPDGTYYLNLRVGVWPTKFTSSTLANVHPLGEEWDEVIVAFAVAELFKKLQQPDDANVWEGTFQNLLESTVEAIREDPDFELDTDMTDYWGHPNPSRDPFTKHMMGSV